MASTVAPATPSRATVEFKKIHAFGERSLLEALELASGITRTEHSENIDTVIFLIYLIF